MKEPVMSEEQALLEIEKFVKKWVKRPDPKLELKDEYENMLWALMYGHLVLDENSNPVYTLTEPVKNDDNEDSVKSISFKTRLKPSTRNDLADGLDLRKQQAKFSSRLISYIISQPVSMLDRFNMEDYDLIAEVSAVFMAGGR